MKILAIETSCDETAIAIAEFSGTRSKPRIKIFANIVSSQVKLHAHYGGVVPNLAKREHQRNLPTVLKTALKEGGLLKVSKQSPNPESQTIEKILQREPELLKNFERSILNLTPPAIDAIAVTIGPGLAPALWVGVNFARALSFLWKKPLIPVNHMAGHVYSPLVSNLQTKNYKLKTIFFPALALLVSGGHTELVLVKNYGKHKIIGETLDDAAGEAFDKVARLLKLGYPGGPEIARLAEKGNPKKYHLPRPMINSLDFNFSFSGLKTAVLYLLRDNPRTKKADVAAAFQEAAVEVLVKKTIRAAKKYNVKTLLLGGGVAANKKLQKGLQRAVEKELPDIHYLIPDISLTGDNAFMIALAAFFTGKPSPWKTMEAKANLRL